MTSAFDLLHHHVQRKLWDMKWTVLRPIQDQAIRHLLLGGGDAVISSPTASGKTEAAFLPVLSAIADTPAGSVRAMYVGPLKALINDQFGRVEELCDRMEMPVCKWHGDVGDGPKQRLVENPAGVLLITPESLEALLVRRPAIIPKLFGRLGFVVVDEMHAFMGTERGAQLICQLHRLLKRAGCDPVRIGLSATLGQPELARKWLRPRGRPAELIDDANATSALQLRVRGIWEQPQNTDTSSGETGEPAPHPTPRELARSILLACRGKTNLVFANAKARIELIADALASEAAEMQLPDEIVVHHGSLSADRRLYAEERLRSAAACTAVCSNTLELGIDIGSIDDVIQVSAPWSVASLAQRVGRSGRRGGPRVLRGYFVERIPDDESDVWDRLHLDFVQGVATIELLLKKFVEPPAVGRAHLSTLVHQCLAFLAETGGVNAAVLFQRVVDSGAFGAVSRDDFKAILRELGRRDLIEQMGDGTLILGLAGQKLVEHYSFFAVFKTPEELRVVHGSDEIGMVTSPPAPGEHLVLGGRRWRVEAIEAERREVIVTPGRGARAPYFVPSRGIVHSAIHAQMKALLVGAEEPKYLDAGALEMLASARAEAGRHDVLHRVAEAFDGGVRLFVFAGSRVQQTLVIALSRADLEVADQDVGIEVRASVEEVVATLRRFVADPDLLGLAKHADCVIRRREFGGEKFETFVAPEVWRQAYARDELDGPGAVAAARAFIAALTSRSGTTAAAETIGSYALNAPTEHAVGAQCALRMRPIVGRDLHHGDADGFLHAALGVPVWGPGAWLSDLELRLGLPPVTSSRTERTFAYARRLEAQLEAEPFYERSFALDPHGTATALLAWRDELAEAGWSGGAIPGAGRRLDALAAAEQSPGPPLPLGLVDRLIRVEREVPRAGRPIYETVQLLEPPQAWPLAWRRLFAQLSRLGTNVEEFKPAVPTPNQGDDLGWTQAQLAADRMRATTCAWSGDGSLLHVRGRTSWELGETVAGLIRARGINDVLVIRLGDAAPVEAAFAAQGLPALGHTPRTALRGPLQVLPLALSLLFAPRDPYRALELLTLPLGPFAGRAATELAAALRQAPGIGSRAWVRAKRKLGSPQDAQNPESLNAAARIVNAIEVWFEGPAFSRSTGVPRADVLAAIGRVREWARTRGEEIGATAAVLEGCASDLEQLVLGHEGEQLLPHELDRLIAHATRSGVGFDVTLEEAGRPHHVSSPSAVGRAHDAIVVWHAGHDAAAHPSARWRASEVRAFDAAGLQLVDAARVAAIEREAWRRAFASARRLFVVATPDTHLSDAHADLPLWDEIVALSGASSAEIDRVTVTAERLLGGQAPCRNLSTDVAVPVNAVSLPEAKDAWTVDATRIRTALRRVRTLAPTAMAHLLACPLRFVIESVLRIRSGVVENLPEKATLYGQLGHRLAEELFAAGALVPSGDIEAHALSGLDKLIETEGGALLMPGMNTEREQVRQSLAGAMGALVRTITESRMEVRGVEVETRAAWDDHELVGRIDLLLRRDDGQEAILDLKWSDSRHRDALLRGEALQLAAYAEIRRRETGSGPPIDGAYFGLKKRRALALVGSSFKAARALDGDSLERTWERAERTLRLVFDRMKAGVVLASAGAEPEVPFLAHHNLVTGDRASHFDSPATAACSHCSNGSLCGRSWKTGL